MGGHILESRDYWLDNSQDINVLEAQALLRSLLSFREYLTSSRVDVHTDSRVLKSALENGGCRSSEVNGVLKDIFRSCREYNFSLDVYYVPSGGNPADLPSRSWSDTDCMLSGSKSNAFSGPTRSISCPWIVTASVIEWVCTYLILRLVQLQNLAVSTSSPILFLWITISMCSRHLS